MNFEVFLLTDVTESLWLSGRASEVCGLIPHEDKTKKKSFDTKEQVSLFHH